jgi:hypothetical protein
VQHVLTLRHQRLMQQGCTLPAGLVAAEGGLQQQTPYQQQQQRALAEPASAPAKVQGARQQGTSPETPDDLLLLQLLRVPPGCGQCQQVLECWRAADQPDPAAAAAGAVVCVRYPGVHQVAQQGLQSASGPKSLAAATAPTAALGQLLLLLQAALVLLKHPRWAHPAVAAAAAAE